MSLTIDFFDFASFSQEIILDGSPYIFRFDWNIREEFWSMSVSKIDGTSIINGIKLVLGYDLFDQYRALDLPPGVMIAIDTTDLIDKIDRYNVLDEVKLVYLTEEEVDAI